MIREVRERSFEAGGVPLAEHPEWSERLPWLYHAVTRRGRGKPFDLGLWGEQPVGTALARWRALRSEVGARAIVHARQVHGAAVAVHDDEASGIVVHGDVDGHASDRPGQFLTVSVADCVPVVLADPRHRAVAAVHAGWRGAAAGILERAIEVMESRWGSDPAELHLHLGPAICARCYEVGPEVHRAVEPGREPPSGPGPLDLRACLAGRAIARGACVERITVSTHCTRCGPGDFFSHRGGDPERQVALIGLREPAGE